MDPQHKMCELSLPESKTIDDTKYFLRDEVAIHNTLDDCWFIINGRVLQFDRFLAKPDVFINDPIRALLVFAGKDISHYFNKDNTPRTRITVHGTILPTLPATREYTKFVTGRVDPKTLIRKTECPIVGIALYWWNSPEFEIGRITAAERPLRIINTLTKNTVTMVVCEEDTINEIRRKYNTRFNAHSNSYTWRMSFRNKRMDAPSGRLDFTRTLTENGFLRERVDFDYPPSLWLFYDDDFSIA